jgi:hypothetical protein
MSKKHMKKCFPSMDIKTMQIKTTLRFHCTLAPSRAPSTTNAGEDVGKKEPSDNAGGNVS